MGIHLDFACLRPLDLAAMPELAEPLRRALAEVEAATGQPMRIYLARRRRIGAKAYLVRGQGVVVLTPECSGPEVLGHELAHLRLWLAGFPVQATRSGVPDLPDSPELPLLHATLANLVQHEAMHTLGWDAPSRHARAIARACAAWLRSLEKRPRPDLWRCIGLACEALQWLRLLDEAQDLRRAVLAAAERFDDAPDPAELELACREAAPRATTPAGMAELFDLLHALLGLPAGSYTHVRLTLPTP